MEKTCILIIDDDPSFRKILEMRLKSFLPGLETTVFEDLQSARQYCESEESLCFDLVIIDEHLPDGSGAEFIQEGWFKNLAVLAVSSDDCPEIPGASLKAGATYFLGKMNVSEPLFQPLVRGLIERNALQRALQEAQLKSAMIDTVRTLIATLRHEINNPLGAVLGAAYLMRNNENASKDQLEAARLAESSGQRIKHVLDKLCEAIELESVTKANQKVFHIPGDSPWDPEKSE